MEPEMMVEVEIQDEMEIMKMEMEPEMMVEMELQESMEFLFIIQDEMEMV